MSAKLERAYEDFYADLRRGAAGQSDTRRAAVELLIEHEHWLRHSGFFDAAVQDDPERNEALIRWDLAAEFLESGPLGSTTELAILRLAVALAQDMFDFTVMGQGHRRLVRAAIITAMGGNP